MPKHLLLKDLENLPVADHAHRPNARRFSLPLASCSQSMASNSSDGTYELSTCVPTAQPQLSSGSDSVLTPCHYPRLQRRLLVGPVCLALFSAVSNLRRRLLVGCFQPPCLPSLNWACVRRLSNSATPKSALMEHDLCTPFFSQNTHTQLAMFPTLDTG